jgi:hypothetical protein
LIEKEEMKLKKEQEMKLIDEKEKKEMVSMTMAKDGQLRKLECDTMNRLTDLKITYKQNPSDKKYSFYNENDPFDLDNGVIDTYKKFTMDYKTIVSDLPILKEKIDNLKLN